jgi:kynurenine formamidase
LSRLVDLSQEIYQGMFVYPGHLKTVIWDHATHEETAPRFDGGFSFHSQGVMLCDHGPTHVDAIKHLDPAPGSPAIDEMPLETFYAPGVCVDVSTVEAPDDIGPDTIESALSDAGLELAQGDALLLRTGTVDRYGGTADYASRYPGLAEETGEWIVERGVRIFGVDSPSPDNPLSRTYPIHMMCRREGLTHYENLANLDQVAGRRFQFIGFPLRIRGGTGSPVRAVAVLEDE